MLTSKEATQMLSAIRLLDTINETTILIGLHASLDAVERESCQRRKDA